MMRKLSRIFDRYLRSSSSGKMKSERNYNKGKVEESEENICDNFLILVSEVKYIHHARSPTVQLPFK